MNHVTFDTIIIVSAERIIKYSLLRDSMTTITSVKIIIKWKIESNKNQLTDDDLDNQKDTCG